MMSLTIMIRRTPTEVGGALVLTVNEISHGSERGLT